MGRLILDRILEVAADLEDRATKIHKKKWRGHVAHRSGVCDAYKVAAEKIRFAALSICYLCDLPSSGVTETGAPMCNDCADEMGCHFKTPEVHE